MSLGYTSGPFVMIDQRVLAELKRVIFGTLLCHTYMEPAMVSAAHFYCWSQFYMPRYVVKWLWFSNLNYSVKPWKLQLRLKVAVNDNNFKIIEFEIFTVYIRQILIFITVQVTNSSAKGFLSKIDVFRKKCGQNTFWDCPAPKLMGSTAQLQLSGREPLNRPARA